MSWSSSSSSLSDQLVLACQDGDVAAAKAAVTAGASVNAKGEARYGRVLPLDAAIVGKHHDAVVWLLSEGADPNGDRIMSIGAFSHASTARTLQLLIDAGGDVNRESGSPRMPPLFNAVNGYNEETVGVLLDQPRLDLGVTYSGKTAEQYAEEEYKPALAHMIAREVRGGGGGGGWWT